MNASGFLRACAVAAALAAPASSAAPADDAACRAAQDKLEGALAHLPPQRCRQDADCGGFSLRGNSCAAPVVLAKRGEPALERELAKDQDGARRACASIWSRQAACAPVPVQARCASGKCVDAAAGKSGSAQPPLPRPTFRYAYFQASCAPWDGAALAFYFTDKDGGCGGIKEPYVSVSINRDLPQGPKTIAIKEFVDSSFGNRCLAPQSCAAAASGTLILESFVKEKEASGRFLLRFRDGTTEQGAFKARWCPTRMFCG